MILLLVMVVPIGVGTAIYLEEYANRERWYNRLLELNIQNLAAVPSIVYGILGSPSSCGHRPRTGAAGGGADPPAARPPHRDRGGAEAIRAVRTRSDRAFALGATQWQVVSRRVLPAAIPGIATGSILALARAIGETAPLLLVGALTYVAVNPTLLGSFTAIQIYQWIARPQDEFRLLAAAGIIVLLVILLTMNAFAIWLRNRYQRRW